MIIFDSSTSILLAKIDMLEIFIANYHGKVLIPEKVKSEICSKGREETPILIKLIKDYKINMLKVRDKRQIKKLMKDFSIDLGEAEVLLLALQEGANIVATDDRNAIRACKMLKLDFATAVCFLIRSFEKGLIEKNEALLKLQKLQSIGRYSRAIIENATEQIKGGV
jgi:predicted nucleic acid-binding protein